MSNYQAIAAVSAALQQMLQHPVMNAVGGSSVGFRRPDAAQGNQGSPMVNIYLYQVTPNTAYRNIDVPTRRANGDLMQKPVAAITLHYLISFHGSEEKLEPQLMMGAVIGTLEAQPLLSPQNITSANAAYPAFANSGLANQVDRVRFTLANLSLEEFSKLWSAFFQVEYSLAITYQASVVLIEADSTAQEAPPVLSRNIYVTTFAQPTITQVLALGATQPGVTLPILPMSTLLIQGTNLLAGLTLVRIGGTLVTPPTVTANSIQMPVPAGMQAGVLAVQVVQQMAMGTPNQPHPGLESNVAPMVLHPVITIGSADATQITVSIAPAVQVNQKVALMLNQVVPPSPLPPMGPPPAAYTFMTTPLTAALSSISFPIAGVAGGMNYFVRVSVDGAESLLDLDPGSLTFGPTVNIP